MTEWLHNAWVGWKTYTSYGKLAAVFLCALLFLLLAEKVRGKARCLTVYGAVAAALCICPVTAVLFMMYQTRFYDYEWIWSVVPVTALAALGVVRFLWRECSGKPLLLRDWIHRGISVILVGGTLFLCGNPGTSDAVSQGQGLTPEEVRNILVQVKEAYGDSDVKLWAPYDVLQYARAVDGEITLFYGRNIADKKLDAYSYDVYPSEYEELFLWMEYVCNTGEWNLMKESDIGSNEKAENTLLGKACVEEGIRRGACAVLLPSELYGKAQDAIGEEAPLEWIMLGEYFLLKPIE